MSKPTPRPDVARLAYSVTHAAQALSLSIVTLRRAINHGLIRSNKAGRVIRIPAAEVERVALEGLPPVPRGYVRQTVGPTKQGRPLGSTKAKLAKRARKAERPRPSA